MTKLCLFDFDGTLVDSMWAWDELGRVTMGEYGIPVPDDYEEIIRTMSVPHFSEYMAEKYSCLPDAKTLLADWHKKMIYNYTHRIAIKPGAAEFLKRLKADGYTIYLASATHYDVLKIALEHFGMTDCFEYILTEETVGISKRNPKIYELCMQHAGVTANGVYVFEDAVHAVETVHKLGMNVCAVQDYSMRDFVPEIKAACDMYITDYNDIQTLLGFIGPAK